MKLVEGVLAAALGIENVCRRHQWRFCFIGGVAVQRWGMPRFTQDVDLTLLTGFGQEERFVDTLLREYGGRLRDTRTFALQRRVLLLRTASGVDLDIALGALPFEERAVARATPWAAKDGLSLTTCSAEDLLVHKAFAGRDRDWGDVQGILARQHGMLNLDQVRQELSELLELREDFSSLDKLESLIVSVQRHATD